MKYTLQWVAAKIGALTYRVIKTISYRGIIPVILVATALALLVIWDVTFFWIVVIEYFLVLFPALVAVITIKRVDSKVIESIAVKQFTFKEIRHLILEIGSIEKFNSDKITVSDTKAAEKLCRDLIKNHINEIPGYESVDSDIYLGTIRFIFDSNEWKRMGKGNSEASGFHSRAYLHSTINCTLSLSEMYASLLHELLHNYSSDEGLTTYATLMLALKSDNKILISGAATSALLYLSTLPLRVTPMQVWRKHERTWDYSSLKKYESFAWYLPRDLEIQNSLKGTEEASLLKEYVPKYVLNCIEATIEMEEKQLSIPDGILDSLNCSDFGDTAPS